MMNWVLRSVMIGLAIGCVVGFNYSQDRTSLENVTLAPAGNAAKATAPDRSQSGSRRSITIRVGRDGHYALDARINGKPVRFLIDTGATRIVLRREDAKRVGLHVRDHNFTERAETANGVIRMAPVVLRDLRVGGLTARNVEAMVNGAPLHRSLLGMDFLGRLDGYEVVGDKLILRW